MRRNLLFLLVLSVFSSVLVAQPTGREGGMIRQQVKAINKRIETVSREIELAPDDHLLRRKRAEIYLELYKALYEQVLGSFYTNKPKKNLSKTSIASKIIADLDFVLKRSPISELYMLRGDMYSIRIREYRARFYWHSRKEVLIELDWVPPARVRNPYKDPIVFDQMWETKDFDLAIEDYERVLEFNLSESDSIEAHYKLARLYGGRAGYLLSSVRRERDFLDGGNRVGYSVFEDIDKYVGHAKFVGILDEGPDYGHHAAFSALYYKGKILEEFGRDAQALAAMYEAEVYISRNVPYDRVPCEFFTKRSELNLRLKRFENALADANELFNNRGRPSRGCLRIYETRGDANLALGRFEDAIADFTAQIDADKKRRAWLAERAAHRKRGRAHFGAGNYEMAIEDISWGEPKHVALPEDLHRLRSVSYRKIGNESAALDEERIADILKRSDERRRSTITYKRALFGKIEMPDGSALDHEKSEVFLIYDDRKIERKSSTVRENGRFSFSDIEPLPFRLFAYTDRVEGGITRRHFVRSEKMSFEGELYGPVVLKLGTSVIKSTSTNGFLPASTSGRQRRTSYASFHRVPSSARP